MCRGGPWNRQDGADDRQHREVKGQASRGDGIRRIHRGSPHEVVQDPLSGLLGVADFSGIQEEHGNSIGEVLAKFAQGMVEVRAGVLGWLALEQACQGLENLGLILAERSDFIQKQVAVLRLQAVNDVLAGKQTDAQIAAGLLNSAVQLLGEFGLELECDGDGFHLRGKPPVYRGLGCFGWWAVYGP